MIDRVSSFSGAFATLNLPSGTYVTYPGSKGGEIDIWMPSS